MQIAQERYGQRVAKKNGGSDLPRCHSLSLFRQLHRVVMDRVGNLVTQSAGEFIGVFHEVQERIDHVDIAAWSRESVGLSFMDEIELEWVVVSRLCCVGDGVRNRSQLIIERRGFDDFALGLQFVEYFLTQLHFFVLILSLPRQWGCCNPDPKEA